MKRDWLNNATFVGFETDEMGQNFEKWNKQGLQRNYYYATADEKRIMCKSSNNQMTFKPSTLIDFSKVSEIPRFWS